MKMQFKSGQFDSIKSDDKGDKPLLGDNKYK
jgi:hypothetical protein